MNDQEKKILILCFSPSGCCADLADAAKTVLEHDAHQVLLCDITDPGDREVLLEHTIKSDLLLLICPVYNRRIPTVVENFITDFRVGARRAVLVLGYGSCGVGRAPEQARKIFGKKNIPLTRVMKYPTEHAYSFAMKAQQNMEDELGGLVFFLRTSVIETSREMPEIYAERDPFGILPTKWRQKLTASLPSTDMNACTLCGECASLCPSGALASDNTTVDASLCLRCGECVRICPEHAKTIRLSPLTKLAMKRGFSKPARTLELTERK